MKLPIILTTILALPVWIWPFAQLKETGEIVKTIQIHDKVSLPFTRQELDLWEREVTDTIQLHKFQQSNMPLIHKEMHNPDGNNVQRLVGYLAQYVNERRNPNLGGRVFKNTDEKARSALRQLIAIQQYWNWNFHHDRWKLPKIAKDRLNVILEETR